MANRRSFKSDESFLEKIAIGAVGTRQVFTDVKRQGHEVLEFERGSMSFKIWKTIKIKRIRVPDLLCVDCGWRIESRAKTSLEVSMSHSLSDPDRRWDSGLDDTDYIAFVGCGRAGKEPVDWKADELVQYVSVRELRFAQSNNQTFLKQPKGAEEGFEQRINWPSSVSRTAGVVAAITPQHMRIRRSSDKRIINLKLFKRSLSLTPLVKVGDSVVENQIVASVIPVLRVLPCDQTITESYYLDLLGNVSQSKRYTAAKALSLIRSPAVLEALNRTLMDSDEHIYVRLEAAASLARHEEETGIRFIKACLLDDYPQHRLEAVIVLCEITSDTATRLLMETLLDETQHPEVRAGAAWALGERRERQAIEALVNSFLAVPEEIRIEATRALAKLATQFTPDVVQQFVHSSSDKRPGIAWALSQSNKITVRDVLDSLVDEDARQWAAYVIGSQDQERFVSEIERLQARDPEVYFAATVFWKIMTSWVFGLEEY
ncbi:MAG: HEAT repeat domain-containing protein [Chloroflexi bacterium]|nr:HEAT repeat domain-containing protein [Chloroflexota bacterium]